MLYNMFIVYIKKYNIKKNKFEAKTIAWNIIIGCVYLRPV